MADPKEECLIVSGEDDHTLQSSEMKSCTGCNTTITPLWRGGPAGPKTLCNACGIKYHKKRRALLGVQKSEKPKSKKKKMKMKTKNSGNANVIYSNGSNGEGKSSVRVPLKIKMAMKKFNGGGVRKFGEEEQAALLLMALSCGSLLRKF